MTQLVVHLVRRDLREDPRIVMPARRHGPRSQTREHGATRLREQTPYFERARIRDVRRRTHVEPFAQAAARHRRTEPVVFDIDVFEIRHIQRYVAVDALFEHRIRETDGELWFAMTRVE